MVCCYRLAAYATPLRTVPSAQPARYHVGTEAEPTQYLTLHPLGPLAELMRNADLRTPDRILAVRARTWVLRLDLAGLTEISFASAEEHGIAPDELVADDRGACQRLAGRLRGEVPGLVVPSAALPGTRNVVLFGARVAAPYLTKPVSDLDVPASITADGARPPTTLAGFVRFRGDPHAELEAFRRGVPFRFREPDWSLA